MLPGLPKPQLINPRVQADTVLQFCACCSGPEQVSTGVSTAGKTYVKCLCSATSQPAWAARRSSPLSSQGYKVRLKWPPAKSSHTQRSHPERCMKVNSLNNWVLAGRKDTSNQSFLFYYSFADRSREKGKHPTITWKIPQYNAQGCGMCPHRKAHHLMQSCCWHNRAIKLKHHLRLWRLKLKNAMPRQILL